MSTEILPLHFILSRLSLTWPEALWGYQQGFLGWSSLVQLAEERLLKGSDDALEIELASLGKEETGRVGEIVRELSKKIPLVAEDEIKKKWLYLVLARVYEKRADLSNPLGRVEDIYSDFGYPQEVAQFVRYMPVTDSYTPGKHSKEENERRLFIKWKEYLDTTQRKYPMTKS